GIRTVVIVFPIEFDPDHEELLESTRTLARERLAPRAAAYDRETDYPLQDFNDLFQAGLLNAVIPCEHGGLGLGPYRGNILTLWLMTKEIAKADLALARCWEGHVNSLVLIDGLGTEQQKEHWFSRVVRNGETWVAWSGEPQARANSETQTFGTITKKVEGGYVVEGS